MTGLFLVDTGCTFTELTQSFAEQAGVRRLENDSVERARGKKAGPATGLAGHLCIANLEVSKYYVYLNAEPGLKQIESQLSLPLSDGIVGGDILRQFRGVLDYDKLQLTFSGSDRSSPPASDEQFVARLVSLPVWNGIAVEAEVDGKRATFLIDTGNNSFGTISANSGLRQVLALIKIPPVEGYVDDRIHVRETSFLVRQFQIGGITGENRQFNGDGRSLKDVFIRGGKIDGFVGLQFFLENKLIIDYGRMEIRRRMPPGRLAITPQNFVTN